MAANRSSAPRPLAVAAGDRIRLRHRSIGLADGSRVGVSVGGSGIPLVFFHGIGMNRRIYLRLLSRLPQLGFTVIAIDAPGHGDSSIPPRGSRSFAARMATTDAILDTLGGGPCSSGAAWAAVRSPRSRRCARNGRSGRC